MKFNKKFKTIIDKHEKYIPRELWMKYKDLKKLLHEIILLRPSQDTSSLDADDCCCICLENDNLMKTFCCNNFIHEMCLFKVLSSNIPCCPFCRANISEVLKYKNDSQYYYIRVLSLISILQINIIAIESIIKQNIISQKYVPVFCQYNQLAIIKISKKIDKHLHIKCKDYFIDIIKKNRIISKNAAAHDSLVKRIVDFFISR